MKAPALILAVLVFAVSARAQITSVNGHPWDLDSTYGYMGDGGGDAFDGYGYVGLRIGSFTEPIFTSNALSGFSLTLSDRTWTTTSAVNAGGIQVARTIYAPLGQNYVRYLDSFTNATASTLTFKALFGGNLGSDSRTTLAQTSSGDNILTTADIWSVTIQHDSFLAAGPAVDPPVGVLFGNTAALARISGYFSSDSFEDPWPGNANDGLSFVFDLTLAPGQTSNLVFFLYRGLSETSAGPLGQLPAAGTEIALASATMAALAVTPDYAGLTAQQIAQIANFTPIPEPSTWGLLLLGGAMVGMGTLRRRRR